LASSDVYVYFLKILQASNTTHSINNSLFHHLIAIAMMIKGDFKVELVEGERNIAYKEHTKGEEMYVEVEPNAECYVSVERIGISLEGGFVARIFVDGKNIGWLLPLPKGRLRRNPVNVVC
jgi:hypothetical protein